MSFAKIGCFVVFIIMINFISSIAFTSTPREYSHIVIDYNNGQIVSAYREHERMYPASLTKIMTLYILFSKIKNNIISFDDKITISKNAAAQAPTKLGLPVGSKILVRDAIIAVIVSSANDMAYAIAETVSSNEKEFVTLMNQTAHQLGLYNTNFANSTGLPNKNQYTTAYDMAILSRNLMIHFNSYYKLFSIHSYSWNGIKYGNTNHLLKYDGIDGIKTGYTRSSGYNLITSAYKNNSRIITVAMGLETSEKRNEYVKNIVQEGLELTENNRKFLIQVEYKPNIIKALLNNKINDDILYISNNNNNDLVNTTYPDEYLLSDYSLSNYNLSSTAYTIAPDPDIQKIRQTDYVVINPYVKKTKHFIKTVNIPYHTASYSIQLGAFSTYQRALNVSFNALKNSNLKNILQKKNLSIVHKGKLFIVQYRNLSANNANYACKALISKKISECFIKTSTPNTSFKKLNSYKKGIKKHALNKNIA